MFFNFNFSKFLLWFSYTSWKLRKNSLFGNWCFINSFIRFRNSSPNFLPLRTIVFLLIFLFKKSLFSIRKVFLNVKEKTWTVLFIFWGFGVPLIMVLISFILENIPGEMHVRPHFGETKCWFRGWFLMLYLCSYVLWKSSEPLNFELILGKVESWSYFHGPISVLLILNTLMFLQSSWTLWKSYRKSTVGSIRSLRFKWVIKTIKFGKVCDLT